MLIANQIETLAVFKTTTADIGWFLIAWTLYIVILWIGTLRIHGAMAFTFITLLIGFILLDIGHFGFPIFNKIASFELMICAFSAWYMIAGIILNEIYGRPLLPMGKP